MECSGTVLTGAGWEGGLWRQREPKEPSLEMGSARGTDGEAGQLETGGQGGGRGGTGRGAVSGQGSPGLPGRVRSWDFAPKSVGK